MMSAVSQSEQNPPKRTRTGRIVRTGVSGLTATALDVGVLAGLVELAGAPVALAAFVGALCGGVVSFLLGKYWAFLSPRPIEPRQILTYAMVSLGTAALMAGAVHVLAITIGMPYLLAKAIAAAAIFLLWSYPAQAKLVFPDAQVAGRHTSC